MEVNIESIPVELRQRDQWVLWRAENDTKIPYCLDGKKADCSNPKTWSSFDAVNMVLISNNGQYSGFGFEFADGGGLVGIDLDDCIDVNGIVAPEAQTILNCLDSYSEISPSGRGIKVFVGGTLPIEGTGRKTSKIDGFGAIEMYHYGRYFTVTGQHVTDTPKYIQDRQNELTKLFHEVFGHAQEAPPGRTNANINDSKRYASCLAYLSKCSDAISGQGGHDAMLHAACECYRFALDDNESYLILKWFNNSKCQPAWSENEINHKLKSARQKIEQAGQFGTRLDDEKTVYSDTWKQHDGVGQASTTNDLPTIIVNNRRTVDIATDAINALVAANATPRLFVRAGELVRIDRDENHIPVIRRIEEMHLRHELARAALCKKAMVSGRGENKTEVFKDVHPPKDIITDLLAAGSWRFPPLSGIVEAPVLRPDGTILDQQGYDDATHLFYVRAPGLDVPTTPDAPDSDDVRFAMDMIDDAIGEFPFDGNASKANALAGLLTPIVRQYIDGHVPLLLIDAPAAGTGKSLLVDVVSHIATGRDTSLITVPRDDVEMDKKITSALSNGSSVICLDNVDSQLFHPSLSVALTRSTWEARRLGHNDQMIRVPQRASWYCTGNNLRLGGDLPRRCYRVRLDSKTARPWERTGYHHPDLLAWVTTNRGNLLAALLTLARAWIVAGKPKGQSPEPGSFERWARTVGGILQFAGVSDFLANLDEMHEQTDDDKPQWGAFLRVWYGSTGSVAITTAQLVRLIENNENVRDALPDCLSGDVTASDSKVHIGTGFSRKLGKGLSKRLGTRFDNNGLRIERASGDTHKNVARWIVKTDSS